MSANQSILDDLILHISPDKFYVESLTFTESVLVIDRISYEISLQASNGQIPNMASRKPIAGIMGVISLMSGPYLVVITKKARIGALQGGSGDVSWVVETEIISYARSEHHLTQTQCETNRKYTEMMKQVLATPYFFFSYNYDLSHSRQRYEENIASSGETMAQSLVERAETRFVWNWKMMEGLRANPSLHRYCLPVIHGFISKPPPTLELQSGVSHRDCFTRHFEVQKQKYGQQVIINLIDQKGAEGRLETQLKAVCNQVSDADLFYEAFDFHKECSKMRYDKLQTLMDRLAQYQEQFSYFVLSREGLVLGRQSGVFRTNCIDCLDRTNVVQSMLARNNLQTALVRFGVLGENARVEHQAVFENLFKNVWADHADMISIQYSGTGALKTDFTRTGKRTKQGVLEDGRRSLIRYFKNNFADGFRQDSLDLFTGNYVISPTEGVTHESPLSRDLSKDQKIVAYPMALALSIAMLILSLVVPSELSTFIMISLLFWAAMAGLTSMAILRNGPDYVDQPHLVHVPPRLRN